MAKRPNPAATPDIIDVGDPIESSEDVQIVTTAGAAVTTFLLGVTKFFKTAKTLETQALATLAASKALVVPTNGDEDVTLQTFIRQTSAEHKAVEEHWQITTAINRFHRHMTGRRKIAVDALDAANKRGNDLHAQYVREEQQRVSRENERLRREAELEEQARRDRELEALEAEAVRREEAASELSAREQTFIDLMFATNNATQSAQRAGYKEALKAGTRLLTLPKICDALEAKRSAAAIRQQAAAIKQAPLLVETPEERQPDVRQAAGAHDRTTHSAELLDEAALIEAIFSGKYGIPRSILKIDTTALNAQARDLKALINKWPGVRYKKTTSVI